MSNHDLDFLWIRAWRASGSPFVLSRRIDNRIPALGTSNLVPAGDKPLGTHDLADLIRPRDFSIRSCLHTKCMDVVGHFEDGGYLSSAEQRLLA